ncbi:MAG: outer membrane beta-barrel protein, partial [Bacteroidales bacterium]|nr:outer membrane beta-barrel protein [Bacteroidales bacterium]
CTSVEQLPANLRESLKNAVVYSWLNTVSKNNWHLTLRLQWKRDGLEAAAWSNMNYDVSRYGVAASTSTDFHYTLGCSAAYGFGKGWKLSLQNSFDSRRKEVYSHTSAYLSGTLRLSRRFGNWSCYAEIRELFDKTIQRTTFSENFDYRRTENTRNYRRLAVLSVEYRF